MNRRQVTTNSSSQTQHLTSSLKILSCQQF